MNVKHTATLFAMALFPALLSAQNSIGTGAVDELYNLHCASCHGEGLMGGQGSSLVDDAWTHGSSDAEIARVIAEGIPDTTMISWKDTLSEEDIRSLVIYIREQGQIAKTKDLPEDHFEPADGVFESMEHDFTLNKVGEGEGILWALEFLSDDTIIATQRDGILWSFENGERTRISGIPEVWHEGQGGLLEVQKHPDYADNGWIYLGYTESKDGGETGMTAISRGRIRDAKWTDHETIFSASSEFHTSAQYHFGTRFVFSDGYLFFAIGDRAQHDGAQDLRRPNGKIHRIFDDGRVPDDNPFSGREDSYPTVWSYGHRNPQGLDKHPLTGDIWGIEHGPRGGDEVNLIQPGRNYGWPVITYGMHYNGRPWTDLTEKEGMEQPKHYWTPSIAICGVDFYEGSEFPAWKNNLFVSGMASQELHRLVIESDEIVMDEIVFKNQGRVRDVYSGPDGLLYVLLIQESSRIGSIYRMSPE